MAPNLTSLLDLDVCLQPAAIGSVSSIAGTIRYLPWCSSGHLGVSEHTSQSLGCPPGGLGNETWALRLTHCAPKFLLISADKVGTGLFLSSSPTDMPHTPPRPSQGHADMFSFSFLSDKIPSAPHIHTYHVLLWAHVSMMASGKADL